MASLKALEGLTTTMKGIHNASLEMAYNSRPSSANEDETPEELEQILSDEMAHVVFMVLLYGVTPAIEVIGIVFNTFSIIVLLKHGLHKCSNILLISLAFSDMCALIGYNNIPNLIYSLQGGGRFIYSESVSLLLYYLYMFFLFMDYVFALSGLCIPTLITFERLIAVFMPLRFGQIITPIRTWIAVISVFLFWMITMAYTCFWYKFEYVWDESLNRTVGIISKSDLFYKNLHAIPMFEEVLFSVKVPPLITVVGCIAISVKVKIMSVKRSKMTSAKTGSTSKTTQTLLAVCFGYICTCTILAIPTYLPKHLSAYSLTRDNPTNMGLLIYMIASLTVCCNCSWNFIVYVAFNKNFRETLQQVLKIPIKK